VVVVAAPWVVVVVDGRVCGIVLGVVEELVEELVVVLDSMVLVVEVLVVVLTGSVVVVVVVEVVVVVGGGGQVHSLGDPGGMHMPGQAASPFGADVSHCSPASSCPFPQTNVRMFLSARISRATRWPITTDDPPILSVPFGQRAGH